MSASSSLDQNKCPQCGTPQDPAATEGLCPRCLVAMNLAPTEAPIARITPKDLPPPPAEIARHFPQLEITECLGRGGMGVVYRARQLQLQRSVALKILAPETEQDSAFAERFTREARALARLSHPNIVTIYDFGKVDGLFYLLMEYVDGMTLRQLLQLKQLSPEQALAVVPRICEALQYAHEHGVVHRDIKPENVLLNKDGQVKIADFGIAKMLGAEQGQRAITRDHQVIGTPHYMAPEQVEHPERVDHRADIYSLGVVFYEMLTGELPLGKFAVPSRKVQVDVRLDEVVLKALEKEPDRRYQHASQVKTDLETIQNTAAPQRIASTEKTPRNPSKTWIAIGTLGLTILAFVAVFPHGCQARRSVNGGVSLSGTENTTGTDLASTAITNATALNSLPNFDLGIWNKPLIHYARNKRPDSWFALIDLDFPDREPWIQPEKLGLPPNAPIADILKKHQQGDLYVPEPDVLVPIRGTLLAPLDLPSVSDPKRVMYQAALKEGVRGLTCRAIADQVISYARTHPALTQFRLKEGERFGIWRPDGKLLLMGVHGKPGDVWVQFVPIGRVAIPASLTLGRAKECEIRIASPSNSGTALDLDSGKIVELPTGIENWSSQEYAFWFYQRHLELAAFFNGQHSWLLAKDVALKPFPNDWNATNIAELRYVLAANIDVPGSPVEVIPMPDRFTRVSFRSNFAQPLAFAFQTAEGRLGRLEVLPITATARTMRLRYRLVQADVPEKER